jgi:tRNA nucleotidyltransferase (CCA-adding enzyme)
MTQPKKWLQGGLLVIEQHMRAPRLTKAGKITELLLKVNSSPLTMAEFQAVIRADHHSLPFYLEQAPAILARMQQVNGSQAPNTLTGAAIGDWVRSQQVKVYQALKYRNQGDKKL